MRGRFCLNEGGVTNYRQPNESKKYSTDHQIFLIINAIYFLFFYLLYSR
ncbi:hypothetical protein [Dorea sp.]